MTDSFQRYMFTSDVTNFVCSDWLFGHYTWKCLTSNACATDLTVAKQYCCNAGDICWTTSTVCASDDSTFTCSSATYTWCCLRNKFIHALRSAEVGKGKQTESLTVMQAVMH